MADEGIHLPVDSHTVAIVIPTYRRGAVLVESLHMLLALEPAADEVIVVDQTPSHSADIELALSTLQAAGRLTWVRLPEPSIPHAMNIGLSTSSSDVVLFLDDDIVPDSELIGAHRAAQGDSCLVAGMVLQPGQRPEPLRPGEGFRFNSDAPAAIREFMGGNFSVRREIAVALGGFDENFVGAAYRFEAEFAHRYVAAHGLIRYEPTAVIDHLAAGSGGTRAYGHHLRTSRPEHSVGAYYYLLRTRGPGWLLQMVWRPLRAIRTRHHLRQPWWIPLTLFAEARGFALAMRLWFRGPRLMGMAS
ncbi:glycosyltransferase family 2 protein [Arenimonas sp.]|uniref:glycosyltransferase family 2 protein n=1 Tax=Arenimonas sp. TaxID=1872635 RepID=UPI0039E6FBC5